MKEEFDDIEIVTEDEEWEEEIDSDEDEIESLSDDEEETAEGGGYRLTFRKYVRKDHRINKNRNDVSISAPSKDTPIIDSYDAAGSFLNNFKISTKYSNTCIVVTKKKNVKPGTYTFTSTWKNRLGKKFNYFKHYIEVL